VTTFNALPILSLFSYGSLFFCRHSKVFCILQHGESLVVTCDCRLILSGSSIKLMFNYIKCCEKSL